MLRLPRYRLHVLSLGLAVASLSGLPACDDAEDTTLYDGIEAVGLLAEQATYRHDWIWGDASALAGGVGFSVTTDLGYRVEIERAWLTNYSVALVPCPEPIFEDEPWAVLADWAIPTAVAGDGSETDASSIDNPLVEDLAVPRTTTMGTVEFPLGDYCRVHVLSASAPAEARSEVDGDPTRVTVLLEGRVLAPTSDSWESLSVRSSLANGTFVELPRDVDVEGALDVTVHRRLDTLLHGIEFDLASAAEVERQVLLNLMGDVSIDVVAPAPGD